MQLECGPPECGSYAKKLKDETDSVQAGILGIFPDLSVEATIFHTKWVRRFGTIYKNNNAYAIIKSDGLDPVFGYVEDLIVLEGMSIVFVVSLCNVLFFDDHYHSYAIDITSQRLFVSELYDHNVYHGHKLIDGYTYITLRYHFH